MARTAKPDPSPENPKWIFRPSLEGRVEENEKWN